MRDTLPLLDQIPFPPIRRGRLDTLQVNVGYRCNQSCVHCHVNAGPEPHRGDERRGRRPGARLPRAPAHRNARHHRRRARAQSAFPPPGDGGARDWACAVMDRCNLTILEQPGQEDLAEFLAGEQVEIVASMPCYLRGQCRPPARQGRVRRLDPRPADSSTRSATAATAPASCSTSSTTRRGRRCRRRRPRSKPTTSACSARRYGIVFNRLFTLANMPIQRFGSMLISKGEFDGYLAAAAATRISTPISTA